MCVKKGAAGFVMVKGFGLYIIYDLKKKRMANGKITKQSKEI